MNDTQEIIQEKPIRTCKKHGDLYRNDLIKSGKTKAGTQCYKCKKCVKLLHESHYQRNKEKVLAKHREYKKENPDKVKVAKAQSFQKNKHKYRKRENERKKIYDREATKLLKDRCIKKILVKRTSLSMRDITPELIECMRAVQQIKRHIKKSKNGKNLGEKHNGES